MKEVAKCLDPNTTFRRIDVKEYGVNYKVYLGKHYDTGIYTDMAAIRERLKGQFNRSKSLLNLYSYTGAFSLFGLKQGMEKVVSVDLSENYIQWLEENIALNEDIDASKHTSMPISTKEALKELKAKDEKFDFIISDPPSSSSDGNRVTNALGDYEETLPKMFELLNEHGQILAFLNTHKVSMDKFKNKLKNIIHRNKLPLYLAHNVYLGDDCPYRKGFPEGSYLKGITLKIKKPREDKKENTSQTPSTKTPHVDIPHGNEASPEKSEVDGNAAPKPIKVQTHKKVTKKVTKKAAKKITKKTAKKSLRKIRLKMIRVNNLNKEFKVHKKEAGFWGSVNSLFNRKYIIKSALKDLSHEVKEG